MKKWFKSLLALVLCVCMIFTMASHASAASLTPRRGSSTLYISDLIMAYGDTRREAFDKLTEKGYTPIDVNLNQRKATDTSNGSKAYVYLGYKSTNDPKKAITDIAAMNMNGDYSISKYAAVLLDSYAYFVKKGEFYQTMANAFRAKYNSGSDAAKKAYTVLNMYYDPDTSMRMGDFFLKGEFFRIDGKSKQWVDEQRTDIYKDPIVKILAEANPDVLTTLDAALAMGVSSYSDTDNVYKRLSAIKEEQLNSPELAEMLDRADNILESVEALGRLIKTAERTIEKVEKENPTATTVTLDDGYMNAYGLSLTFQEVKLWNDTTLYDLITKPELTQSDLLPIILALGEGQYEAILVGGAMSFFLSEQVTPQASAESKQTFNDLFSSGIAFAQAGIDIDNMVYENKVEENSAFSIYNGVDTSVFKGNVGVTDNANASMALDNGEGFPLWGNIDRAAEVALVAAAGVVAIGVAYTAYNWYNAAEKLSSVQAKQVAKAAYYKEIIATKSAQYEEAVHGFGAAVRDIAFEEAEKTADINKINNLKDVKASFLKEANDLKGTVTAMEAEAEKSAKAMEKAVSKATDAVSKAQLAFKVATGVLMIVAAIFTALELYNYYNPDLKEIPLMMMDRKYDTKTREYHYVSYSCVMTTDGDAGDVNELDEQEWIALYYTKDVNSGGAPLKVQYSGGERANFAPIHTFGSSTAYNMNQFTFASNLPIVNLSFEKGDRNLLLASSFSEGGKHALVASVGLLAGFGLAFGTSTIVAKGKKKKEDLAED